jgi:hypothetical protein
MATACFRLLTFAPELPLLRVPFFRSCIARLTVLEAALLYFRAMNSPRLIRDPTAPRGRGESERAEPGCGRTPTKGRGA